MADYLSNPTIKHAISNSYQKTNPTRFCYSVPSTWQLNPSYNNSSINYVIATWSGTRRKGNEQLSVNPLLYLQHHLEAVQRLQHNIFQITIVVPDNPHEPKAYTEYLKEIESNQKITIQRRPNEGQSYGSYVDCYKKFGDKFQFYICVEDDYLPVQPHFDQILVQMFQACQNCGYLCSRVDKYPPTNYMGRPHAAISNGITSSEVLQSIINKLGDIPCGKLDSQKYPYAATPQLEFSWAFLDTGWWLYDYSPFYSAPYHHVGKIQHYGSIQKPPFFVPAQTVQN